MSNSILVCGLNGAGKSTIGRHLAARLNRRFIDIEDLYFPEDNTDYKYSNPRSFEEVQNILCEIVKNGEDFVLAVSKGNFNKEIISSFKCVIFISASKKIRLQRVYERSYQKFGDRIHVGGDLYEREKAFFDMVKLKDEKIVENWIKSLSCKVIKINGTLPILENIELILKQL